ncbi:DNA-binding transcriptional ArsR family regulator [Peribacillus deserti]|uniref:DNA-binding transcriptional ArsR family regulator n=1 Tax=Peribacillus deserti TaxID=673318 RepID=A0ABS2QDJ0_9BACI|nr:metalloregulator ArsR/SmtB family transcription factor [Peribacillus deserti]MBM7691231.1 DNA-binding transcriptional ArsR family regulator [Peribacillus deserti]
MTEAARHDVFQAIADPTRRKLLQLLSEEEMPINALAAHFPISRTAVAKHLAILSDANLITGKKAGREKRFALHPEPLLEVKEWVAYYERFWDNKLSMLKHLVEKDGEIEGLKEAEKRKTT